MEIYRDSGLVIDFGDELDVDQEITLNVVVDDHDQYNNIDYYLNKEEAEKIVKHLTEVFEL